MPPSQSKISSKSSKPSRLNSLYEQLLSIYGPQDWWPGEGGRDEIVIGAVLTQNCSWTNVEKAFRQLREAEAVSLERVASLEHAQLAELLRPVGYFNVKARRLHATADWFGEACDFRLDRLEKWGDQQLREGLLSIKGVGEETADDIMVYAYERCSFVVDTYTRRILERHGFAKGGETYGEIQAICERAIPRTSRDYNEAHALLCDIAKRHCSKRTPNCEECPLYAEEFFASKAALRRWDKNQ